MRPLRPLTLASFSKRSDEDICSVTLKSYEHEKQFVVSENRKSWFQDFSSEPVVQQQVQSKTTFTFADYSEAKKKFESCCIDAIKNKHF